MLLPQGPGKDVYKRQLEERTVWFEQHDRGRFPLIVAEEDKRAVGYASLSVYRDNDAYAATVELLSLIHI